MEPLTEVVLGQVNVPIRQLAVKCQGASKQKTPDGKGLGGRGNESCNLTLELYLGTESREISGRRLASWSRGDRERDMAGGKFAGTVQGPWSLG